MFVLNLARDNTERLPGDVPRYSATELATGEPPRPTVDVGKPIVRPNQGEMVAELVEEQIDVMRDQVLASAVRDPGEQHVVRDELLENADGVGDGFDDDPGGVGAAVGMPFVDGAAKGVPDDDAVVAEAAVVASSAQGLDLGVPGAGQKGDDDVAGGHQPATLGGERSRIEPITPWPTGIRVGADPGAHSIRFDADLRHGAFESVTETIRVDRSS